MSKFFEWINGGEHCENCSKTKGFFIRIGRFKNRSFINPINFEEYNGLTAKYFVLSFRTDSFAKQNYSLRERLIMFTMYRPHKDFIKQMRGSHEDL